MAGRIGLDHQLSKAFREVNFREGKYIDPKTTLNDKKDFRYDAKAGKRIDYNSKKRSIIILIDFTCRSDFQLVVGKVWLHTG